MGRDESGTVARLLNHLNQRLAPAVARRSGRVVRLKGDGGLIEFASAVDALAAAIDFQQGMVEANRDEPVNKAIVFRVGLHLGDVIVDGDDIYGDDVNVAARLEAEAPAGGIVVSRTARDFVGERIRARFTDLGTLVLKNIERPVPAYRVEWDAADWPRASQAVPKTPARPDLTLPDKPSIAVLPFQNMSADSEQAYFVDGLVEDIMTALSRFSQFFVVARNSSFTYKARPVDVRQVGRELGVRYVLEGSVRKASNRLRITGQLVDTASGNHLWADRFDGALEDVFEFQDKVTTSVVSAIYPKMQQAEIARAQAKPTENLGAYDLYQRAVALMYEFSEKSHNRAVALLERAIAIDPRYSTAYGLMANLEQQRAMRNWSPFEEARARSLTAAWKAVETGRDNPQALMQGGFIITRFGDRPEEGLAYLQRALELNPNSTSAMRSMGGALWRTGDHESSIRHFERAMQLGPMEPLVAGSYAGIAHPYFFTGRYEQALAWLAKALPHRRHHIPTILLHLGCVAKVGRLADDLQQALTQLRSQMPDASIAKALQMLGPARPADREHYAAALRLAGLPE
jgi:TolB-like protein/Tfp pilus assembly protein PilF